MQMMENCKKKKVQQKNELGVLLEYWSVPIIFSLQSFYSSLLLKRSNSEVQPFFCIFDISIYTKRMYPMSSGTYEKSSVLAYPPKFYRLRTVNHIVVTSL